MAFNEGGRRGRWAWAALALVILVPAAGRAAEEPPAPPPSALEALSRVQAAKELAAGGVASNIWPGLKPAGIPVLVVEERRGRTPFALLVGHPDPPPGLRLLERSEDDLPAALGPSIKLPKGAASPVEIGGVATALVRRGETFNQPEVGEHPAEVEILAIVHHIMHVHQAGLMGPEYGHRPDLSELPGTPPEAVALFTLESRILAEILFSSPRNTGYVADLAAQLQAVRRAREAIMPAGAQSAYAGVERAEALPVYTEYEILSLLGAKRVATPGAGPEDSSYRSFQYNIVWRMSRVFAPLIEPATTPGQAAGRASRTGAGLAIALDRVRASGWRERAMASPPAALPDLLAEAVPLDASAQEEALRRAQSGFGYEAILALVRERAALD